MPSVAILTVSDRSSQGSRPDLSGPSLIEEIRKLGWDIVDYSIVADESAQIQNYLINWSESHPVDLILTTGGTGFTPRDITPEATLLIIERLTPGLSEFMRMKSMEKTPHAMLSRAVSGIRKNTLIINLPGSPKAAVENLQFVLPVLPHAFQLLTKPDQAENSHQFTQGDHNG
jgi:molybdenum cofactor synthesis domain-containing protein